MAYCPFGSADEAARVARQLVEERLAACANILGAATSIYHWEGAVQTESETAALFKLPADMADAFMDRLTELHSYDEPAIACWNIDSAPASFAKWVQGQVTNS